PISLNSHNFDENDTGNDTVNVYGAVNYHERILLSSGGVLFAVVLQAEPAAHIGLLPQSPTRATAGRAAFVRALRHLNTESTNTIKTQVIIMPVRAVSR